MQTVAVSAGVVLGLAFLLAGLGKVLSRDRFRETLLLSGAVPPRLVPAARLALPLLEVAAGLLLLSGYLHPFGAVLALGLLGVFTARTWSTAVSGSSIPCSCFGTTGELLDAGMLARNLVLAGYAAAAVAHPLSAERIIDAYARGSTSRPVPVWVTTLCLLLTPFIVAEAVSLWQAAPRVAAEHLHASVEEGGGV